MDGPRFVVWASYAHGNGYKFPELSAFIQRLSFLFFFYLWATNTKDVCLKVTAHSLNFPENTRQVPKSPSPREQFVHCSVKDKQGVLRGSFCVLLIQQLINQGSPRSSCPAEMFLARFLISCRLSKGRALRGQVMIRLTTYHFITYSLENRVVSLSVCVSSSVTRLWFGARPALLGRVQHFPLLL